MTPDEYAELARLRCRLAAAERVCVLYSWSLPRENDVGKALSESWEEWRKMSGVDCSPEAHPRLYAHVPVLAAMRDAQMAVVFGPDDSTVDRYFDRED